MWLAEKHWSNFSHLENVRDHTLMMIHEDILNFLDNRFCALYPSFDSGQQSPYFLMVLAIHQ